MRFLQNAPSHRFLLLPILGMSIFVLLYILAALNYPGGSWNDPTSTQFSFWNNYLCDLLDQVAVNGELNSGRFYARAALGVLCISLLYLWAHIPFLFSRRNWNTVLMWLSGILALTITMLLSSGTHDLTVRIAGAFGAIAFLSAFAEMRVAGYSGLMRFGWLCLFIFLGNYYIYETGSGIQTLPVVQKATFSCYIAWFVWLNITLFRHLKRLTKVKMTLEKG